MQFKTELIHKGNLTEAECRVLLMVCDAWQTKSIADFLAVSARTVENQLISIHEKLGIKHTSLNARVALLRVAISRGMVRMVCVLLAVSAVHLDDQSQATRVRFSRARSSLFRRVE